MEWLLLEKVIFPEVWQYIPIHNYSIEPEHVAGNYRNSFCVMIDSFAVVSDRSEPFTDTATRSRGIIHPTLIQIPPSGENVIYRLHQAVAIERRPEAGREDLWVKNFLNGLVCDSSLPYQEA